MMRTNMIKRGVRRMPLRAWNAAQCARGMLRMLCLGSMVCCGVLLSVPLYADVYSDIDDHIQNKRLSEARALIQATLNNNATDSRLYLQLAALFEYQSNHQDAIQTLKRGLLSVSESQELLYYNMGNNYFALQQYPAAEEAYSTAIQFNALYEPLYINRANTRVWREDYVGAIEDYTLYLTYAPQGQHHGEVRRMVSVLRDLLRTEEDRERERLEREKQALNDALFLLGDSYSEGLNSRAPSASIDEIDIELDIVD